ncbi:Nn.00g098890.m01.CDS01 [Neocucurbitaria sp. VM-36]
MAYTKNYYHVLGLEAPSWGSKERLAAIEVRRAYKIALLAAHPDKNSATPRQTKAAYTVDDVKEAYKTLADSKSKADYDNWLLHNGDTLRSSSSSPLSSSIPHHHAQQPNSDFILGLELLDLSDFYAVDTHADGTTTTNAATTSTLPTSTNASDNDHGGEGEGEGKMEWTRPCRCGAEKGFRILEEELEDAEGRGEKEVLVGCEGCSLWVRVGFDVEEG